MNTLQQEQNVNPAFDENVLKAAGRAAQIEQKAVVIASNLLDAVMVAYDEDKPNKALVPVFIQHITEAIATARAEGAAEEQRELVKAKNFIKYLLYSRGGHITLMLDPAFEPEKWEIVRQSIVGDLAEVISLEALTTKEHHAS